MNVEMWKLQIPKMNAMDVAFTTDRATGGDGWIATCNGSELFSKTFATLRKSLDCRLNPLCQVRERFFVPAFSSSTTKWAIY